MRKPETPVEKARRARNRERMRKSRAAAKKKRRCRVCGKPVVKSPRTGRPSRSCAKHLADDRVRKTPIELTFDVEPATWLEIPLEWIEDDELDTSLVGARRLQWRK